MTLQKTFCSSPWFHMRINNSGSYEYCRWAAINNTTRINHAHNIAVQKPLEFFQRTMSPVRQQLLDGQGPAGCSDCYIMEQHGKVSGRQRQLLKAGIQESYFEKTLASSPMKPAFDYSLVNQGHTDRMVTDWQIDLGNFCNSACVFCNPESSSRLASEFKRLQIIDSVPRASWCEQTDLLDVFVKDLVSSPNLRYLHFLGGETLITPGFETILQALVDADLCGQVTVGFTTNLTVWPQKIIDLLTKFQKVNLGMSIETITPLNDYVRWPSEIDSVKQHMMRWLTVATQHHWLTQLRITPTCLTVHELTTVYDFAWQHNLSVESCNFLDRPEHLRISVLPEHVRQQIITDLESWIENRRVNAVDKIVNTRDPNQAQAQIVQDASSYLGYLKDSPDESFRLPDLVQYLKLLESSRGNSIISYIPQYEKLFRSAGY